MLSIMFIFKLLEYYDYTQQLYRYFNNDIKLSSHVDLITVKKLSNIALSLWRGYFIILCSIVQFYYYTLKHFWRISFLKNKWYKGTYYY